MSQTTTLAMDAVIAPQWAGEFPYFLFIVRENTEHKIIDIEEYQWQKTYADWRRGRMRWYLCRKADNGVMFGVEVYEGDQPWCIVHHSTDLTGPRAGMQWTAYGIGVTRQKKRHGLWVTQDGLVCDDIDVETLMRG